MIHAALILWLLVVTQAAAQGLPALPEDQRAQFAAIGRVNQAGFKTRGLCSGTLIAPDLVLTAAHCLPDRPPGTTRMFVAGYDRGDYLAARPFLRVARHPLWQAGLGAPYDIGLIWLDAPITGVAPLPLAIAAPAQVAIVGYHGARPGLLSGDLACPAGDHGATLRIGCEVIPGNSGGPVLARGADGWQVVGVVSARQGGQAWAARIDDWVRVMLDD